MHNNNQRGSPPWRSKKIGSEFSWNVGDASVESKLLTEEETDFLDTVEQTRAEIDNTICEVHHVDRIDTVRRHTLRAHARSGLFTILSSLGAQGVPIILSDAAEVLMGLITSDFAELKDFRSAQVVVDPDLHTKLSRLNGMQRNAYARHLADRAKHNWKIEITVSGSILGNLLSELEEIVRQPLEGSMFRAISPDPSTPRYEQA